MPESEVIKVCDCHALRVCPTRWMGGTDERSTIRITLKDGRRCWVTPDGMAHYTLADAQTRLKKMRHRYVPEQELGGEG
jgi:uncharacterized protein (DUF1786 family)